VTDKRVLKLIRAFLKSGVMEGGLVSPVDEGTPQGGPLSPLLSNLVLDDLDKELTRRGHRFCRYADDCNIYVRSRRAGERVMTSVCRFLTEKVRLKVNEAKSAVARPEERKFLGFSISNDGSKRRITASIICASYLLVSLPGFYARNARSINAEDFGSQPAFIKLWRIDSRRIDVNNLIAAEHITFVLGVILFALFIVFKVGRWL
jgi:hypothetical protein